MKNLRELAQGFAALFASCIIIGACVGLVLASAYAVVKLVVEAVQ